MLYQPTEKIQYINNKQQNGIVIDWDKVRREFSRLKVPKDTCTPFDADFNQCAFVIDLSDRSRGKTTNKLLLGLVLYKMYGVVMHYIRHSKDEITPRMLRDLYKTVIDYDYIKKIFNNQFDDIIYRSKRWFLVKRDDNDGTIKDTDEQHCTFCIGLDEAEKLKSTYNSPTGDMIFFDEFISRIYKSRDFPDFADICKTIIRDRVSTTIFMSANTINKNSLWFDDLLIRDKVDKMKMGDSEYIHTDNGTSIFLEILDPLKSVQRENVNKRYFGFGNNGKLISITGKGTWATDYYQHIPDYDPDDKNDTFEELNNKVFIKISNKFLKLRLVNDNKRGLCVFVTPATKTYDDSIIMTTEEITKRNEIYGLGAGTFFDYYMRLYKQNKFYYSRNSEGELFRAYYTLCMSKIV